MAAWTTHARFQNRGARSLSPKEIHLAVRSKGSRGRRCHEPHDPLFEASPSALRPETRRKVASFYKRPPPAESSHRTPPQAA
jgi:hypothetical protein